VDGDRHVLRRRRNAWGASVNLDQVATLAQTLLYEGYLLYPYRASSVKNRHRWLFGTLYPRGFAEAQDEGDRWWMQTECLVQGTDAAVVEARVRFLLITETGTAEHEVGSLPRLLRDLIVTPQTTAFGVEVGIDREPLKGNLDLYARRVDAGVHMLRAVVRNLTLYDASLADQREHRRDRALASAFAAPHMLLSVTNGQFASLVDPPEPLMAAARACENIGTWPVLVGDPATRNAMLSAPIVLEDYPRLAPESPGDFFDATEIDELLTLRVLTLTDEEKQAMHAGDPKVRALLERTEAQDEAHRHRLHGASRPPMLSGGKAALDAGTRVRLCPRRGGDILDIALAGKTATVARVEHDYEGRILVAVTIDDDPGRDLGVEGWPGHRFFFRSDEIEIVE
jgi:hypothetical protein